MKMLHVSRSLEPVDSDIGPSKPGTFYIFLVALSTPTSSGT